jgi:hypothetical protein
MFRFTEVVELPEQEEKEFVLFYILNNNQEI